MSDYEQLPDCLGFEVIEGLIGQTWGLMGLKGVLRGHRVPRGQGAHGGSKKDLGAPRVSWREPSHGVTEFGFFITPSNV